MGNGTIFQDGHSRVRVVFWFNEITGITGDNMYCESGSLDPGKLIRIRIHLVVATGADPDPVHRRTFEDQTTDTN